MFPESLLVTERGLWQWHKRDIAEAEREGGIWVGQIYGELQIVDLFQAGECFLRGLLSRNSVKSLDVGEEGLLLLQVRAVGSVIPGIDVALRGDRFTVVEGPARFQRDVEMSRVLVGLNFCRMIQNHRAVGVIAHQARVEHAEDIATTGFIGVSGVQRRLWFGVLNHNEPCADLLLVSAAGSKRGSWQDDCQQSRQDLADMQREFSFSAEGRCVQVCGTERLLLSELPPEFLPGMEGAGGNGSMHREPF